MIQSFSPENQPPLSIVLERLDVTPDGRFRPAAFVKLTQAFRKSGLLQALPPEELKSFLTLLSFLTPNGECSPALGQVAGAMRVSHGKARARMQRLAAVRFEAEPLVTLFTRGDGQEAYALRSTHIPVLEQPLTEIKPEPLRGVPRDRIIEYSRNRYAKTREEVERQIAEINGWDVPQDKAAHEIGQISKTEISDGETPQLKDLRRRLLNVGIASEQTESLLSGFEAERIERQLQWLPFRHARNPSAYLVAAIVGDYEEPIQRK